MRDCFAFTFTVKPSTNPRDFNLPHQLSTYLVFGGNLGNNLDDCAFKLLNANILEDDCSLGEQSHICGYFFTLRPQEHMVYSFVMEEFSQGNKIIQVKI